MLRSLRREMCLLENKARFISEVNEGKLIIQNIKKDMVIDTLIQRNFKSQLELDDMDPSQDKSTSSDSSNRNFDYLLSMALWSLTQERVE